MRIAVVTPTYNRSDFLKELYVSLINQNGRESLSWIVIDDGSNDSTKKIIENFKKENLIKIDYIYQKNSGKAAALNLAFNTFKLFDFFLIVDSDDRLMDNVYSSIETEILKYKDDSNIGAIFFRYMNSTNEILSSKKDHIDKTVIMKRSEHDSRYGKYDGCVGYYKRVTSNYNYPTFYGENYLGPTVLQLMMEDEFEIVFSKKVIGIAEYQESGLTNSGRLLRLKNPNGMKVYSFLILKKTNSYTLKIKYAIYYNMYNYFSHVFSNKSEDVQEKSKYIKITKPFGYLLYVYYKNKYKELLK